MLTYKSNSGFALTELLVYIGIISIVAGVLTGILTTVTTTQVKESEQNEVSGQLNFAMQTIQRLVRDSSLISLDTGIATSTLTLRTSASSTDPTIISLSGSTIYVQQGSGNAQALTNNSVTVDFLEFKKFSQYPGKDVVQIDLALSGAQISGETIRRSLRSAVSRVSAATFDSDLLPGIDDSYSVGLSPSTRWKNAIFSGSVGIGVSSLLNKLDISGGLAIGSYASSSSTPTNGLLVSGNVGIATSSPAFTLGVGGTLGVTSTTTLLGYVGIATSSPQYTLDVDGTFRVASTSTSTFAGALGIGTVSPSEKLEVSGNIKLSGGSPTYKITNVAEPTASSDVATKGYVDAAGGGGTLTWKGYTGSTNGDVNYLKGGNALCESSYTGSHWASYREIMALGSSYPWTSDAWVWDGVIGYVYNTDASLGVKNIGITADGYSEYGDSAFSDSTCSGWNYGTSTGESGPVLRTSGYIEFRGCSYTYYLPCVAYE